MMDPEPSQIFAKKMKKHDTEIQMNSRARIWVVALLMVPMLHCGISRCAAATLLPSAEPEEPTLPDLQTRVDALIATQDTIMIRRNIADVFDLIDRLLAKDQQEDAMPYLSAALKHNAWALDYQMHYAELAAQRGEPAVAKQKAQLVLEHTEQDELYARAVSILDYAPLPDLSPIEHTEPDTTTLVLVPLGSVDRCVLNELVVDLAAALRIPVIVRDAEVEIPGSARDPVSRHLATVRTNILNGMKQDAQLASFLKQHSLSEGMLQKDEGVITACRHIAFESGGKDALAQFDAGLRELRQAPKQWDIEILMQSLKAALRAFERPKVYFIGVANLDCFADQSNFIFGSAENSGPYGVITYRRFTSEFTRENPNRERLVDRTFKQVLSSFGFMLGLQRCSMPTCARAYPHSLEEHDAKSRDLCPDCQSGFDQ